VQVVLQAAPLALCGDGEAVPRLLHLGDAGTQVVGEDDESPSACQLLRLRGFDLLGIRQQDAWQ
jgi:hypothetical protein